MVTKRNSDSILSHDDSPSLSPNQAGGLPSSQTEERNNYTEGKVHWQQVEQALQTDNNFTNIVIDSLPGVFFVIDREGHYVRWNKAQIARLGITDQQMRQTSAFSVLYEEDVEYIVKKMDEVFSQGHAEAEVRVRSRKNGEAFYYITGNKMDIDGIPYIIGTGIDITERKRRERELESITLVGAALRKGATRAELLEIIIGQIATLFNTDFAAIGIYQAPNGRLKIEIAKGRRAEELTGVDLPEEGTWDKIIQDRQVYINNDCKSAPKDMAINLLFDGSVLVCFPLITPNSTIGILIIGREDAFPDSERRLLDAIADMAANALQRTALYEQTERYARQMATAGETGRLLTETLDLPKIYHSLGKAIYELIPDICGVFISLYDATHEMITCAYALMDDEQIDPESLPPVPLEPPGRGTQSEAIHTRSPIIINNLRERLKHVSKLVHVGAPGLLSQSGLYVPMLAQGRVMGVVQVQSYTLGRFTQSDAEVLTLIGNTAAVAIENARLFQDIQRKNLDLTQAYDATIEGWSHAMDLRDRETEGHTLRVAAMALQLGRAMGISEDDLVHMRRGALLHDIGKMGIPDRILLKPDKLTEEEWWVMQMHPQYAYEMIASIDYLRPAIDIPYYHHEKWDGTGYPRKLKGEEIPLVARIFAVVDVWDALTSDRPYRAAWPIDRALEYIRSQAGTHFDPLVADMFLRLFGGITDKK